MVKSPNESRRKEEQIHQKQMKLAAYKYSDRDWMDILQPLVPAIEIDYPYLEKEIRDELLELWAGVCKKYFAKWADNGMGEELAGVYRKMMMWHYQNIFNNGRDLMFLRNELKEAKRRAE